MINRKIRNATVIECDGIRFRSKLEAGAYKALKESGVYFRHEPFAVTLLDGWKPRTQRFIRNKWETSKARKWEYTPDFVIEKDNMVIFVEIKGFSNDVMPYKRKMLLKYLDENYDNAQYWEIYSVTVLKQLLKSLV